MSETELEKRKRCPKCDEPGQQQAVLPTQNLTKKALTMKCLNKRCEWFDTGWVITVMLDGSLPEVDAPEVLRAKPRAFPVLEPGANGDKREAEIKAQLGWYDSQIKKS